LNPVLVFLLTLVFGRAAWSGRMGLAAVLAFTGAAVIAWEGFYVTATRSFFVGDVLLFGAVFTWAAYTVVSVPLAARYGPLRTLAIVLTVGSVMYLPALLIDGRQLFTADWTPRVLGGLLYITLLTSYMNYLLWFVALTRVDVNQLAVATNTTPIVAVTGAYFWHNEPLSSGLLTGGVILLIAITLANWHRIRQLYRAAGTPSKPTSSSG
jgi:drug/metabolite transporter (DMT)-like permease